MIKKNVVSVFLLLLFIFGTIESSFANIKEQKQKKQDLENLKKIAISICGIEDEGVRSFYDLILLAVMTGKNTLLIENTSSIQRKQNTHIKYIENFLSIINKTPIKINAHLKGHKSKQNGSTLFFTNKQLPNGYIVNEAQSTVFLLAGEGFKEENTYFTFKTKVPFWEEEKETEKTIGFSEIKKNNWVNTREVFNNFKNDIIVSEELAEDAVSFLKELNEEVCGIYCQPDQKDFLIDLLKAYVLIDYLRGFRSSMGAYTEDLKVFKSILGISNSDQIFISENNVTAFFDNKFSEFIQLFDEKIKQYWDREQYHLRYNYGIIKVAEIFNYLFSDLDDVKALSFLPNENYFVGISSNKKESDLLLYSAKYALTDQAFDSFIENKMPIDRRIRTNLGRYEISMKIPPYLGDRLMLISQKGMELYDISSPHATNWNLLTTFYLDQNAEKSILDADIDSPGNNIIIQTSEEFIRLKKSAKGKWIKQQNKLVLNWRKFKNDSKQIYFANFGKRIVFLSKKNGIVVVNDKFQFIEFEKTNEDTNEDDETFKFAFNPSSNKLVTYSELNKKFFVTDMSSKDLKLTPLENLSSEQNLEYLSIKDDLLVIIKSASQGHVLELWDVNGEICFGKVENIGLPDAQFWNVSFNRRNTYFFVSFRRTNIPLYYSQVFQFTKTLKKTNG